MLKSKTSIIVFSALNALLMTIFTFLWINKSYILTDDEEYMIKMTSGIRKTVLENLNLLEDRRPNPDEFLFVDIAFEKELIDEKGPEDYIGKRAITNRARIAELLSYLNKTNQHKFIILDVFFKDSSNYQSDSLLQSAFSKTKNILIPYHTLPDGTPDMPIFDTPVALSDYDKDDIDNNFVKFNVLYNNKFRTTPLVMYETLHDKKFKNRGLFGTSDGKLALSSFILDLRIWNYNLSGNEEITSLKEIANITTYQRVYLSNILNPAFSDSLRNEIFPTKDKIIIIGDFSEGDIHETIYGATPGPLILLNVYLALREGDNLFSIWFILFLFGGFYFISYNCFRGKDLFVSFINKISKKVKQFNRASFFLNFMSYILYFILLSVLSFFLFNIHITILLLAVYMEVLEKVVSYIRKKNLPPGAENTVKDH